MSLLNTLASAALSSVLGNKSAGGNNIAMSLISELVNQKGGVSGLISSLASSGLQNQVQSWVGNGENEPVDKQALVSSLGEDTLGNLAGKLGVDSNQAGDLLQKFLPDIINQLTPAGKVEDESQLQNGLSALLGQLTK